MKTTVYYVTNSDQIKKHSNGDNLKPKKVGFADGEDLYRITSFKYDDHEIEDKVAWANHSGTIMDRDEAESWISGSSAQMHVGIDEYGSGIIVDCDLSQFDDDEAKYKDPDKFDKKSKGVFEMLRLEINTLRDLHSLSEYSKSDWKDKIKNKIK